jgi:hypothetical protein
MHLLKNPLFLKLLVPAILGTSLAGRSSPTTLAQTLLSLFAEGLSRGGLKEVDDGKT